MSYRLCVWQLMEQPVEQPCNCVERKERTRCLNILIMKIHYINKIKFEIGLEPACRTLGYLVSTLTTELPRPYHDILSDTW